MTATYTKLRDGNWGLRVTSSVRAGDTIEATRKDGSRKTETIGRVLWTGDGISFCSIASSRPPAREDRFAGVRRRWERNFRDYADAYGEGAAIRRYGHGSGC